MVPPVDVEQLSVATVDAIIHFFVLLVFRASLLLMTFTKPVKTRICCEFRLDLAAFVPLKVLRQLPSLNLFSFLVRSRGVMYWWR